MANENNGSKGFTYSATPEWVVEIPAKLSKYITDKLLYREGKFGLFKACEDSVIPFDIPHSNINFTILSQIQAVEKLPGYSSKGIEDLASFLKSCQQPDSGLFIDPMLDERYENREDIYQYTLFRHAVSKYAIAFLKMLGEKPLYPYAAIGDKEKLNVNDYLKFIKEADWSKPWGAGSHTAFRTVELFNLVNEGQKEYIPALCEGIEIILSHQDPETGMWGEGNLPLHEGISGALKVIGRLKFQIGMDIPNMDKLADSIIKHQKNGDFFNCSESILIPRNALEMAIACLESSDYRREELLLTVGSLINDMRGYILPDGSIKDLRSGNQPVQWCGAGIAPKSGKPRGTGVGAICMTYSIGLAAEYLGWSDCTLKSPLEGWRRKLEQYHIVPVVSRDGKVEIVERNR